jgi:hypothetical protein
MGTDIPHIGLIGNANLLLPETVVNWTGVTLKQKRAKRRGVRRLVKPIVRRAEELSRRCTSHPVIIAPRPASLPGVF